MPVYGSRRTKDGPKGCQTGVATFDGGSPELLAYSAIGRNPRGVSEWLFDGAYGVVATRLPVAQESRVQFSLGTPLPL